LSLHFDDESKERKHLFHPLGRGKAKVRFDLGGVDA